MESLKLEDHFFFVKKFGSIYYVITLGIQHHKDWKFYIQSKLTKYINKFLQLSISLASDDCSKTRRAVNLFLNIEEIYK